MIKINNLTKGLAAALVMASAGSAIAETVTVPATVSVNNAIDFQFTGALDFGILRATADATLDTCAILELPANPASAVAAVASGAGTLCTAGAGTAVLQSVGGVIARPEFTIAGVAPFTNLVLTLPAASITLTAAAVPPGSANFTVGNFTAWRTSGTPGAVTTAISTTAAGTAAFTVGAQIATHVGAIVGPVYQDSTPYTGSFDVEVAYN
ncbi:hypothetical protein [Rheinheimera gaetbuli]